MRLIDGIPRYIPQYSNKYSGIPHVVQNNLRYPAQERNPDKRGKVKEEYQDIGWKM